MKYRFPEEFISRVRESNDLVEVAAEYMTLTKSGDRYKGLCPFHREDTPSFHISAEKQLYHCFGCGVGGNVINFVMNIENLDFLDTVKVLAERSGIPLPEQEANGSYSKRYKLQEELYRINLEAARFFVSHLERSKKPKLYLKSRGLDVKTIRHFGLGYAPEGWDNLLKHLRSKGYNEEAIEKSGLMSEKKSGSGMYDRFRDRIIFPIMDVRNRVIGFGGRTIGDETGPKYLNSPETSVFTKGNNLYGLNIAKKHIDDGEIIVVEGYMDVISLHQKGINNTVASLGTAFTANQGELLKRYSRNIVIAYDSDAAGQSATIKGMDVLQSVGCKVRILELPEGKDPDEFVRNHGSGAFGRIVEKALPLMDYKIRLLERKYDIRDRQQKFDFLHETAALLAGLDSDLEIAEYVKDISQRTEVYETVLRKEIEDVRKRDRGRKGNMYGKNRHNNSAGEYSLSFKPANIQAEKNILVMAIKDGNYRREIASKLEAADLVDDLHRNLFEIIKSKYIDRELIPADLVDQFDDQIEVNRVVALIEAELPLSEEEKGKLVEDCIRTIRIHKYKTKSSELKGMIDELASRTERTREDEKTLGEYWTEFVDMQKKLRGL